jgi:hypothetical protein
MPFGEGRKGVCTDYALGLLLEELVYQEDAAKHHGRGKEDHGLGLALETNGDDGQHHGQAAGQQLRPT